MYEIIEKNEYGVLVNNTTKNKPCDICKYKDIPCFENPCRTKCSGRIGYYLKDQEAAKLESEKSIKKQFKEIESIFNIDDDTIKNKKLTTDEFVVETRKILSKIDKEFRTANTLVRVTEEEYEKQDCDNCKGGCVIVRNGKELNCTPDKNDGDCFVLDFQHEQFVEEIENIMFHNPTYLFYDLLSCEVENINSDSQKELLDLQNENKKLKEKIKELETKCKSEYQRGVEDGKIIAEHGTTMWQD